MMEGAVMEYAKWFIGMVSLFFIIIAVVFMFKLNEMNVFQQEVNYQIERHGGLTEEAIESLNVFAKEKFGIDSDSAITTSKSVMESGEYHFFLQEYKKDGGRDVLYYREEPARYGTPITYVLRRKIASGILTIEPSIVGESASRVRGVVTE